MGYSPANFLFDLEARRLSPHTRFGQPFLTLSVSSNAGIDNRQGALTSGLSIGALGVRAFLHTF